MKKKWAIFLILVLFMAVPKISTAFGNFFNKSLCDFPFGTGGYFNVKYDQRNFDSDYYAGSYPNGGIKLLLFLGKFDTIEERDNIVQKIYWVRYTNKSVGSTYLLTTPDKYMILDTPTAEYSVWIGSKRWVIGYWVISACTKTGTYTGSFRITEDMLDNQSPAIAVDPILKEGSNGEITVTAEHTNGTNYKARIFDDEGNIVDERAWPPLGCSGNPCILTTVYDADTVAEYGEEQFRIETIIRDQDWPEMVPNESCKAYEMYPGGDSRSIIYLKLQVP